jgi:hypothetical protein
MFAVGMFFKKKSIIITLQIFREHLLVGRGIAVPYCNIILKLGADISWNWLCGEQETWW